ncbi:heavy-metal-associated domain-containing protein [Culicoidibacter larvae]|nr:heavy metal-associated domain-containing protein [Culicoidibacter larvae]
METFNLVVPSMECDGCERAVTKALQHVKGVMVVDVDLAEKSVSVVTDGSIELQQLVDAISDAGHTVAA